MYIKTKMNPDSNGMISLKNKLSEREENLQSSLNRLVSRKAIFELLEDAFGDLQKSVIDIAVDFRNTKKNQSQAVAVITILDEDLPRFLSILRNTLDIILESCRMKAKTWGQDGIANSSYTCWEGEHRFFIDEKPEKFVIKLLTNKSHHHNTAQ